ncbi:MAG: ABC transporter permease [Methanomassiliicoccales archaeon]|jgi:peptide/nickel transport system permease protein
MIKMSPRYKWFLSKIVRFVIISFLVLTIAFILPRLMPGDPIENLFGETVTRVDPVVRDSLEEKYGLDEPIWNQYVTFLSTIFSFDFGHSISLSLDVNYLISRRLFWTMALILPAIAIGAVFSLVLAIRCGMRRDGYADKILSFMAITIHTVPGFLIAMIFVRLFSFQLGWFPLGHLSSGTETGFAYYEDIAYHLFLPITVLSLLVGSSKFLILRNSVTQINEDYFIFVARSKGLSEEKIARKYVMRNIMPIFLSILALNLGFIVSGALLIEIVFSIQGMGTLMYDAIMMQDYPVIQAVFIIMTFMVLSMNLLAELLYGIADPRVGDSLDRGVNV